MFQRAVWASRQRVFVANRVLGDAKSVYRVKFDQLEKQMRADSSTAKVFESADWPERVLLEFTKRYGAIPEQFR